MTPIACSTTAFPRAATRSRSSTRSAAPDGHTATDARVKTCAAGWTTCPYGPATRASIGPVAPAGPEVGTPTPAPTVTPVAGRDRQLPIETPPTEVPQSPYPYYLTNVIGGEDTEARYIDLTWSEDGVSDNPRNPKVDVQAASTELAEMPPRSSGLRSPRRPTSRTGPFYLSSKTDQSSIVLESSRRMGGRAVELPAARGATDRPQ